MRYLSTYLSAFRPSPEVNLLKEQMKLEKLWDLINPRLDLPGQLKTNHTWYRGSSVGQTISKPWPWVWQSMQLSTGNRASIPHAEVGPQTTELSTA